MEERRLASKQQKALLFVLQDGLCAACGKELSLFDADHVFPWSDGGPTETKNLQLLCKICHKEKTRSHRARDNRI